MIVLWFQGPGGPPFQFHCMQGQGINVFRLAAQVELEPSPLMLNGMVVDFDSSTGYLPVPDLQAALGEHAGTTRESAMQVTGQPAGAAGGGAAAAAAGGDSLSLQLLREPLLEMVSELRVTNTYLRNSACWQFKYTTSQATQHWDPNFKQVLIETYGCQDPQQPDKLFCMALGKFVSQNLVCAVHLFKYSWRNEVAQVLGFTNINDPANGLLLVKPVEEAFDNGYMCITWEGRHGDDRAQGDYRMLWLGPPELLIDDTTHYPWKTNQKLPSEDLAQLHKLNERHDLRFADLHKKVMTFNTDARPFRRCLVFQARFAAKQALAEGRFNEEQLAEMKPYLVAVSLQASHIQMYWQRMPDEGPDVPPNPAPVEDLVYAHAPNSFSDAEDD